jgi:hypothetical protein
MRSLQGQHVHLIFVIKTTYSVFVQVSRGYHIALHPTADADAVYPSIVSASSLLLNRIFILPSYSLSPPLYEINHHLPVTPHICLVPPNTSPCTLVQSIDLSNSSSNLPTTATLSPRTMYKPSGTSSLGTSSSRGRMMRSMADWRTRFMLPSHENNVPIMVRPSRVRTVTRSVWRCQRLRERRRRKKGGSVHTV